MKNAKKYLKISGIALGILIFSISTVYLFSGSSKSTLADELSIKHEEQAAIELKLSQTKEKAQILSAELDKTNIELEDLRKQRESKRVEIDSIINNNIAEDNKGIINETKKETAQAASFSLDCMALAVRTAETSNCTKGVGASLNNCYGITKGGLRNGFVAYKNTQASTEAFKVLWVRVYGSHFATWNDAIKYTGNKNPTGWYSIVSNTYSKCIKS